MTKEACPGEASRGPEEMGLSQIAVASVTVEPGKARSSYWTWLGAKRTGVVGERQRDLGSWRAGLWPVAGCERRRQVLSPDRQRLPLLEQLNRLRGRWQSGDRKQSVQKLRRDSRPLNALLNQGSANIGESTSPHTPTPALAPWRKG